MRTPIPPPEPAPPHRIPNWPLPSYRYVPGLNPHPFRHPDGHSYIDGSAPEALQWSSQLPWEEDRAYIRGLDLFDHRYYWESHELWEGIWHQVPRDSSYSRLLQALIQSGAYCLKVHSGSYDIANRLLGRVQMRIEAVVDAEGAHYRGLHLPEVMRRLAAFQPHGPWPTLHNTADFDRINPDGI